MTSLLGLDRRVDSRSNTMVLSVRMNQQPEDLRLPPSIIDDAETEQHLRDSAWRQIIRGDDNTDDYVE